MRKLDSMTPEERTLFLIEEERKLREFMRTARARREAELAPTQ